VSLQDGLQGPVDLPQLPDGQVQRGRLLARRRGPRLRGRFGTP
jgi:hypothetical protein